MLDGENIPAFRFGETVYLNSGSPPLRVIGMRDDGRVEVIWTEGDAVTRADFLPACLTRLADDGRLA